MGPVGRTLPTGRSPYLVLIALLCTPLLLSCSSPRYLRNIPCTKTRGFDSISLISNRFSSKNTLRLYFGANTMWYLQFQDVCAKILVSMLSFFIDNPPFVFSVLTGRSILIISQTEDFSHRLTSIEPRDYRVVFVIQ